MPNKGLFITFEGIDGAGKTTQIIRLERTLIEKGYSVVRTREPGGTSISDQIRSMLLSPENKIMHPKTEALLYAASRAQHVEEVIRPSLAQGAIVLCDRFVDASIAYQGGGLQLGEDSVQAINDFALSGLYPDLTLLFDLPLSESRKRLMQSRGEAALDRIEQRDEAYFERVKRAFDGLAQRHPDVIHKVDARQDVGVLEQEIHTIVWKHIIKTHYTT